MMETAISSRTCTDETGESHTFHYYLLSQEILADHFSCENYGVKIVSSDGTHASVPGITPSQTRIMALLELLIEHVVTPTNLPDIIEDWL
ncbi:MAG: hypothetical protein J6A62_08010 [Oscillospiraceae bacterium]|nr:hypothetical protein [Oscillospiraceae bacterium]